MQTLLIAGTPAAVREIVYPLGDADCCPRLQTMLIERENKTDGSILLALVCVPMSHPRLPAVQARLFTEISALIQKGDCVSVHSR